MRQDSGGKGPSHPVSLGEVTAGKQGWSSWGQSLRSDSDSDRECGWCPRSNRGAALRGPQERSQDREEVLLHTDTHTGK